MGVVEVRQGLEVRLLVPVDDDVVDAGEVREIEIRLEARPFFDGMAVAPPDGLRTLTTERLLGYA